MGRGVTSGRRVGGILWPRRSGRNVRRPATRFVRSIASSALRPGGCLSDNSRRVELARRVARDALAGVVELAVRIAETPAPTGAERVRAELVAGLFAARGYT